MKFIITLTLLSFFSTFAHASPERAGRCARAAESAVYEAYGEAIEAGDLVAVTSSTVSKNPSIYKVLVWLLDGSGEPFRVALDVTLNPKSCKNPTISYSK